jgi:hypothetical protein
MKHLFLAIVLFVSTTVFSQSFDGVDISGDIPTAVSKFKAKGYTVTNYFENGVQLKGKVANRQIQLFVFNTPKSKKIFKMTAYLSEEYSWPSLRSSYYDMVSTLTNKYGEPDESEASFITPYYLGDGYELQAVTLEKVDYHAYWFKRNNLTVGVEISKYKQVKLTYENNLMMDLKDKEMAEIEAKSF